MLTNKYTGLMAGVAVAAVFSIATVAAGRTEKRLSICRTRDSGDAG